MTPRTTRRSRTEAARTTDEAAIKRQVSAHRRELAALLAGLSEDQWDTQSLCDGWRVREVVAHLTMPFRLSLPGFVLEMVKARGNMNRMADRYARRGAAALSSRDLVATLENNVDHPWRPPGGGYAGALSHDVIHGLDLAVPLGLDASLPAERLQYVLPRSDDRGVRYFGVDLAGVELRANDLDWSFGSGAPLTGRAQDLLLVVCGRQLPAGRLTGAVADRFTAG